MGKYKRKRGGDPCGVPSCPPTPPSPTPDEKLKNKKTRSEKPCSVTAPAPAPVTLTLDEKSELDFLRCKLGSLTKENSARARYQQVLQTALGDYPDRVAKLNELAEAEAKLAMMKALESNPDPRYLNYNVERLWTDWRVAEARYEEEQRKSHLLRLFLDVSEAQIMRMARTTKPTTTAVQTGSLEATFADVRQALGPHTKGLDDARRAISGLEKAQEAPRIRRMLDFVKALTDELQTTEEGRAKVQQLSDSIFGTNNAFAQEYFQHGNQEFKDNILVGLFNREEVWLMTGIMPNAQHREAQAIRASEADTKLRDHENEHFTSVSIKHLPLLNASVTQELKRLDDYQPTLSLEGVTAEMERLKLKAKSQELQNLENLENLKVNHDSVLEGLRNDLCEDKRRHREELEKKDAEIKALKDKEVQMTFTIGDLNQKIRGLGNELITRRDKIYDLNFQLQVQSANEEYALTKLKQAEAEAADLRAQLHDQAIHSEAAEELKQVKEDCLMLRRTLQTNKAAEDDRIEKANMPLRSENRRLEKERERLKQSSNEWCFKHNKAINERDSLQERLDLVEVEVKKYRETADRAAQMGQEIAAMLHPDSVKMVLPDLIQT